MVDADRVLVIGFPGELAKNTAKRLACSHERSVFVLSLPGQNAEQSEFLKECNGRIHFVEGSEKKIDFGLSGQNYNALAEEITAIAYLKLPEPRKTIGWRADTRPSMREIIELGLAAPHLKHIVVLSHLDVAGTSITTFAEHDLDIGQKWSDLAQEDRFRAERILRRFVRTLPLTIVRTGWIAGEGEGCCPLILLILAADEQIFTEGKGALNDLYFIDEQSIELILTGILGSSTPPLNTLHIAFADSPPLSELAAKVRKLAARFVPVGFDLAAGARRVLRRADGHQIWLAKDFFRKQPSAKRISTALSEKILKERNLPVPALSDSLLDQLVAAAMERIIGYK